MITHTISGIFCVQKQVPKSSAKIEKILQLCKFMCDKADYYTY